MYTLELAFVFIPRTSFTKTGLISAWLGYIFEILVAGFKTSRKGESNINYAGENGVRMPLEKLGWCIWLDFSR